MSALACRDTWTCHCLPANCSVSFQHTYILLFVRKQARASVASAFPPVRHVSMPPWSNGSLPAQSFWTRLTFGLRGVTVLQVVGGPAGREAIGRAKRVFTAAAAAASLPVLASSPRHCCQIQPDCGSPCCRWPPPAGAGCRRLPHRGEAAGQRRDSGAKRSSSCQQSTRGAPERSERRGGWDRYASPKHLPSALTSTGKHVIQPQNRQTKVGAIGAVGILKVCPR